MRNHPFGIHAVAAESSTELIVDAPVGHAFQCHADHGARLAVVVAHGGVETEREIGRMRKLGRRAESAMLGIELRFNSASADSGAVRGGPASPGVRGSRLASAS